MKSNHLLRAICLLILMVSLFPASHTSALVAVTPPPVDMFQLPWDQGIAWFAIDGIDNGIRRPTSSSHNYRLGGAIDFAPKVRMTTGEDTSSYWVTAAAAGTVVATSSCYVTLAHVGGWVTQYQFLGNIQVRLGDAVARNQRLATIADGVRQRYCPGFEEINVPHLHFILRPSMVGATFGGWQVNYNSMLNRTSFAKGSTTVGLNQPLLNVMDVAATATPIGTASGTPTVTPTASATPTLSGPYVSTTTSPQSINIGGLALVTVRLNNVPTEGYRSAEFTCSYTANLLEVSNIQVAPLFGADPASAINGPGAQSFIVAIAGSHGDKAATSGIAFKFDVKGLQAGQTIIQCRARVSQGNNQLMEIPFVGDSLTILGGTATPNLTSTPTPTSTSTGVTNTPTQTFTPGVPTQSPTPTSGGSTATATPGADWLTFTNSKYGFQFLYPKEAKILAGRTDNFAHINLPFTQGTNLTQKYLEVIVAENANPCQSPLVTSSGLETSTTVVINGLTFLKQTGSDGITSHIVKWVAYSTSRNDVCVSLDFVLFVANPGVFPTPPPLYNEAAESAVFGQIVGTYMWLASATPTITSTGLPTGTATPTPSTGTSIPTSTSTPASSSTPTGAAILGQVIVTKPAVINVYDTNNVLVATKQSSDGKFSFAVAPGTYTVVAVAPGFLRAQRTITLMTGITNILPTIPLPAGDIDANNLIDQFDALTIGMSYNSSTPAAADLNNDGIINVLDLELLAQSYRKTGPVAW